MVKWSREVQVTTIGAAKAKAHFLSILDDVANRREPVIVTKNGHPVARIVPMPLLETDPIFGFYKGKLEISGDVLSPLYTDDELDEFLERSVAQLG
jgi:prevent-host-death family protein